MNWIDFSKERPKAPGRQIRVRYHDLSEDIWWIGGTGGFGPQPTHWAEIEPPDKEHIESLHHIPEVSKMVLYDHPQPPTPGPSDPLRAAWRKIRHPTWNITDQEYFKAGWDAAIKWKEGQ